MEVTRGDRYKLTSSFVKQELYNTPSIINIIHPDNNETELLFLTALINSSLFTWYHLKVHSKAQAKTSIPKILVREVRNLPFPKSNPDLNLKISQLSRKAMDSDSDTIMDISLEIDQLVYQLYDLTEEEIEIIENN
ncbi:MAG: TaqI-like C-terminal specificity domain-containing protein [Cyclobacteriaceae bacterium]